MRISHLELELKMIPGKAVTFTVPGQWNWDGQETITMLRPQESILTPSEIITFTVHTRIPLHLHYHGMVLKILIQFPLHQLLHVWELEWVNRITHLKQVTFLPISA